MRLATRRSALALAQAELVARELGGCELVPITTGGDRGAPAQDKSRWVDELERALLEGRADLAVHSAKDLPGELADGLRAGRRARRGPAPEDVLCGAGGPRRAGVRGPGGDEQHPADRPAAGRPRGPRGDRAARQRGHPPGAAGRSAPATCRRSCWPAPACTGSGASRAPARASTRRASCRLRARGRSRSRCAPGTRPRGTRRPRDQRPRGVREPAGRAGAGPRARRRLPHAAGGVGAARRANGELHLRAWVGLPDGSAWVSDELCGASDDPAGAGRGDGATAAQRRGARAAGARAGEMAGV